jgi:hypothetical protein
VKWEILPFWVAWAATERVPLTMGRPASSRAICLLVRNKGRPALQSAGAAWRRGCGALASLPGWLLLSDVPHLTQAARLGNKISFQRSNSGDPGSYREVASQVALKDTVLVGLAVIGGGTAAVLVGYPDVAGSTGRGALPIRP